LAISAFISGRSKRETLKPPAAERMVKATAGGSLAEYMRADHELDVVNHRASERAAIAGAGQLMDHLERFARRVIDK
jgi:hypothetical protein